MCFIGLEYGFMATVDVILGMYEESVSLMLDRLDAIAELYRQIAKFTGKGTSCRVRQRGDANVVNARRRVNEFFLSCFIKTVLRRYIYETAQGTDLDIKLAKQK